MTEQKSVIFSFFLWDGQAKRGLGAGGNQDRKLCEVMERMSNEERGKEEKKKKKEATHTGGSNLTVTQLLCLLMKNLA